MERICGRWAKESRSCGAIGGLGLLNRIFELFLVKKNTVEDAFRHAESLT